jgi:hypothetical protein
MIGDRKRIAGLAPGAADLLFDLLEAGLDLPACAVVLGDLRHAECEAGRQQSDLWLPHLWDSPLIKAMHEK